MPRLWMASPFSQTEEQMLRTAIATNSSSSSFLPVRAEVTSSPRSHQNCLQSLWNATRGRRLLSATAALCTRQRKITQGWLPLGKGLEHSTPWFQPEHPETNPSHKLAETLPKPRTLWLQRTITLLWEIITL